MFGALGWAPAWLEAGAATAPSATQPTALVLAISHISADVRDVAFDVTIDAAGKPIKILLVHSSGQKDVDDSLEQTIRQGNYTPAMRGGKPIATSLRVTFILRPEVPEAVATTQP